MRGFLGSFRVKPSKSGRSDWIRTSDPYPPRKRPVAKSLKYRAAGLHLFLFCAVPVHPFLGITQKPARHH